MKGLSKADDRPFTRQFLVGLGISFAAALIIVFSLLMIGVYTAEVIWK